MNKKTKIFEMAPQNTNIPIRGKKKSENATSLNNCSIGDLKLPTFQNQLL